MCEVFRDFFQCFEMYAVEDSGGWDGGFGGSEFLDDIARDRFRAGVCVREGYV